MSKAVFGGDFSSDSGARPSPMTEPDASNARTVTRTQVDNIPRRFIAGGFGSQRKSANFRSLCKRGNCLKIPEEAG